jgi:hypothetical protein
MVLAAVEWEPIATTHADRADALTAGHVSRKRLRQKHPVEDFLFTYYQTRPGQLRVWHPGPGIRLLDAPAYASRRGYRAVSDGVELDPNEIGRRAESTAWIHKLLTATIDRPAQFGCFGMHEWAMVYRQPAEQVRHNTWPLRLGTTGTDPVVESHRIACSHFDAFRFFTGAARRLNTMQPTREQQPALEQGGCLHANMDLYKWAAKLMPFTPGPLLLDCLELARDIREVDMRASPYDLSGLGYEPVRIETTAGKTAYAAAQRGFADRAGPLRQRLIDLCETLLRFER